jgi:two-component system cell cycle sensor histidine kinase/response regulator CckA
MKVPPRPQDEARRLSALREYRLLDTSPDQTLDDLTALAAYICEAPISLISLVDEERQWFKSNLGMSVCETPRDASFCGHAILASEPLIVPDAAADERFVDNPLVTGEPFIRFYAGTPLVTPEGQAIGTLCIIDRVPRILSALQLEALRVLSRQVMAQLELRRHMRELLATQRALEASEARNRALFDYAPDGIVVTDAQAYYLDGNPSVCRMLGLSRDELIGLHASDIVTPTEVEYIEPTLSAIRARSDFRREWQFRRKDGSVFAAEVMATTMPDGNLLGMIRDITERRALEQQFFRAQRMESLGTLAGGIAHDLNNVLAPILLSLEMLREVVVDEDGREFLGLLQGSAQRGAELVKQVLSFARGVEGERIAVDLAHLVRDLLSVMRETFPKSISVRFKPPHDLWTVTGDPTQLHQVILNLCVNARDAMPNGGRITLSLENVVLDESYATMHLEARPGSYVVTRVADTGPGIPAEIRDRIFDPFFTTKEVGKGTGLGLSTTLAIVKRHGGFFHLETEIGQGTTFEVFLPADRKAAVSELSGVEDSHLPRGNGETVLVVDDEPAIRRIVQGTLERYGYRVLLAENGAEGLSQYAAHRTEVAVVFTDMAMPVLDGATLILALRKMNPQVRIVACSGVASIDGVARAREAGVSDFVPKPYTAETLLQTLRKLLRDQA